MDWGHLNQLSRKLILTVAVMILFHVDRATLMAQDIVPPSVTVTVNKSIIYRLGQRVKSISVTQPEIAEVVVLTPQQVLIHGKSVGSTSLVIFDEKQVATNYDLIVTPDLASLRSQLRSLFPEEKVEVSASGSAIVLRGEVSNEVVYDKVLEIAQTYLPPRPKEEVAPPAATQTVTVRAPEPRLPTTGTAFAGGGQLAFVEEGSLTDPERWGIRRSMPGIIDLLVIKEVRQIQLNVIVAEVSLTKLRELGLDFTVFGRTTSFRSNAGSQSGFQSGTLLNNISPATPGGGVDIPTLTFGGATSAILTHVSNNVQISTIYRLFQNRDITEILAQPNLVIKNGRSGGFLAGGEFPFPVPQSAGAGGAATITIEFKPFGVRLDFVPTITWSGSIDLRVFPEVSEIDTSVQILTSGIQVPGLRVRRSVSRLEMKEGESLVMSGLVDRRIIKDLTKFPILGDIPILGALFRGTRFRNQESELVIVVTPTIVRALKPGEKPPLPSLERYDDPDMRQIPLPSYPPTEAAPGGPPRGPAPQGPTIP